MLRSSSVLLPLSSSIDATTYLIGIGNLLRRDDGVGLVVARTLCDRLPAGTAAWESGADPSELVSLLSRCRRAVLVDAAVGIPPGQVARFDALSDPLPFSAATSSHTLPLPQILALAAALGSLPDKVTLYAIGARDFSFGEGLSAEVEAAVELAALQVLAELSV